MPRSLPAIRLARLAASTLLISTISATTALAAFSDKEGAPSQRKIPTLNRETVHARAFAIARAYLRDFRHPQTHVLYGARLKTKDHWTTPDDVKSGKPHPWGYGSRIADTALHCGHMLVALLDAYQAHPDPFLEDNIRKTFSALRFIGSLPERHPKPSLPDLIGLVPRGPHPDDPTAYYDDSSMDQHTTYIIALALYARSTLATEEEQAWIRESLQRVGRRLERHGWSIKRGDGVTEAHVGFAWTGFNAHHASILLPAVLALYHGTGDPHWKQTYEKFLAERDGLRWKKLHPGPHVRINAHPIYANQSAFRIRALYQMEENRSRRKVLRALLKQMATMQCQRDFPGSFYRRFHSDLQWQRLRQRWEWPDDDLHGARQAWKLFRPEMLDSGSLPVLAHVRFPLGAMHMVLLTEDMDMIREYLPQIWEMLTRVDLSKISAGETQYLMTVVALHTYAFLHRHARDRQDRGNSETPTSLDSPEPALPEPLAGVPALPLIDRVTLGPAIDVAVEGKRAYVIGNGRLICLEIAGTKKPRVLASLAGLGNVRQILVEKGLAYITSREDGLWIVDVSQPENLRIVNHYDTVEFATGLAKVGKYLLIACRHFGVEIIDVSSPSAPRHVTTVRTGEAQSLAARGRWAYVGVWATSEVVVIDLAAETGPAVVARVPLQGYGDGVALAGRYLFAATGHHRRGLPHRHPDEPGFGRGHGLEIFDVSDPAQPRPISRVSFPQWYSIGNDMWSVTVRGRHAFVADTHNGVFVVDIGDPQSPRIVAYRRLDAVGPRKVPDFVGGLAVIPGVILAAGGQTGLYLMKADPFTTNRPPAPASKPGPKATQVQIDGISALEMPPCYRRVDVLSFGGQVHAVAVADNRAFLACGSEGIRVVALHDLSTADDRPIWRGTSFVTDLAIADRFLYAAAGRDGLIIFELLEGNRLIERGRYLASGKPVRQLELIPSQKKILLQVSSTFFEVVDVRDPAKPNRVLRDSQRGLLYGDQLMRGVVDGRYAGVFWHVSGIHFYDLAATQRPRRVGGIPLRIGASNGIVAVGRQVLMTRRGGYSLVELGQLDPLEAVPLCAVGPRHDDLGKPVVLGTTLYTSNRAQGTVRVMDVSNWQRPKRQHTIRMSGHPGRVARVGRRLLIPAGYQGLVIMTTPYEGDKSEGH